MVEIRNEGIINVPQIKWDVEAFTRLKMSYDKRRDILFLHSQPKRPAVSVDVGGRFWLRLDPSTGEMVGVEIEDFERVYLVKYPELRLGWDSVKPKVIKLFKKAPNHLDDYLRIIYQWLQDATRQHPTQTRFA
jgi:uncharacterized protein YuzE